MSSTVREEKNAIRAEMLKKRLEISEDEKSSLEAEIIKKFTSLTSFRYADTILLYYPIKGEVNVLPIMEKAIAQGKKIAFPRCQESGIMSFHYVSDLSELNTGKFSIPEPSEELPKYSRKSSEHDIIIVPAVTYDRKGYRIGYGKGYYDRYLCSFKGTVVGISLDRFMSKELPRGRYDKQVNVVLTEKGVYTS